MANSNQPGIDNAQKGYMKKTVEILSALYENDIILIMGSGEQIDKTINYPKIDADSEDLDIIRKLGEGGTKSVYEAVLDGKNVAISVPNFSDTHEIRNQKWAKTEKEPENTAFLREKGLLVNPLCETKRLNINEEETDCLISTPFSQLPFSIYDGKDGSSTWDNGPLDFINSPDDILDNLNLVARDVKTLIESRILLKRDSISFGIKNQTTRLFLFDLSDMQVDSSFNKKELAIFYANTVIEKLDNLFSFNKIRILEQNGYTFSKKREIAKKLTKLALSQD